MKRYLPVLLIFLFIYLEVAVFVKVANLLGVAVTLILIVLSSLVGFALLKRQGLRILQEVQDKVGRGENVADEMLRSAALLLAAVCFIVPGFVSDLFGLLLLIPFYPSRLLLKLFPYFSARFYHVTTPPTGNVFEGEYQQKGEEPSTKRDHANQGLPKK